MKIYCTACNREVSTDRDGNLRAHLAADTVARTIHADGAQCPGSGVHWEVARATVSAHLKVGQVVRVGSESGPWAVVQRQTAEGTVLFYGDDRLPDHVSKTRLFPVEVSLGTQRGWERAANLRAAAFEAAEVTVLRARLEEQGFGVLYLNGEVYFGEERVAQINTDEDGGGWVNMYTQSSYTQAEIFIALSQALEGEEIAQRPLALTPERSEEGTERSEEGTERSEGSSESAPPARHWLVAKIHELLEAGEDVRAIEIIHDTLIPVHGEEAAYQMIFGRSGPEVGLGSQESGEDSIDEEGAPLPDPEALKRAVEPLAAHPLARILQLTDKALAEMAENPMLSPETRVTLTDKGREALEDNESADARIWSALRRAPAPLIIREALDHTNGSQYVELEPNQWGAYVDDRRRHYHPTRWMRAEQGSWLEGHHTDYYPDLTYYYDPDLAPVDGGFKVEREVSGWGAYSLTGDLYVTYGVGSSPSEAVHQADLHLINQHYVENGRPAPYLGLSQCWLVAALNEDGDLETAIIPHSVTDERAEALDMADLPQAVIASAALHLIEPFDGHYRAFSSSQGAANYLMDLVDAESAPH